MKIYITTLGRLNEQVTLLNLPEDLQKQVIMVVQAHEYHAHLEKWGSIVGEVRSLDSTIDNLGPTRRQVHDWAKAEADDLKYVMLDDDLYFYERASWAAEEWHLLNASGDSVRELFAWVAGALDTHLHVGVSGREGNNRGPNGSVETTRYMRMLCYRTDMPTEVEHGRVSGMSDFDVNLQLLRLGHASRVTYHWAQGHKTTQAPGGCSLNRTHETHEREIEEMLGWHYPYARPRDKINKTGGEFGTRRELTIYWKKALESARG